MAAAELSAVRFAEKRRIRSISSEGGGPAGSSGAVTEPLTSEPLSERRCEPL